MNIKVNTEANSVDLKYSKSVILYLVLFLNILNIETKKEETQSLKSI